MPPQQGEVSLSTLFADVHYYFSPPTQSPPHHRFDKGSYVYLYHSPMRQSGRIEIANHAGTPNQDAFAGQLDTVKIQQTYKHPCLFTITVDAFRSQSGSAASSPHQDVSQWHLPTPDPMNQGKYMYRLHTVDLYFWTPKDATMFLDSLRRVLQPEQLHIVADPDTTPVLFEHKTDTMNPLIANLEKAAISQSHRKPSITTTQSFPGPPTAPAPSSSPPAEHYAPMAYNPAAPAAPEPIAHRDKTPPPPDSDNEPGYGAAFVHDQNGQQYSNPLQASFTPQPTSGPYTPGPPAPGYGFSGPPNPGMQRTNTVGSMPSPPQSPPSFAPPPQSAPPPQYDQQAPSPPGLQRHSTVSNPLPSPGFAPQQTYQPITSPPQGGYSQYQYGSTSQQAHGTNSHNMHQQVYRPTEQEANTQDHGPASQPNSNIGKRVDKVEKGIGKFLKKLDKKF